MIKGRSKARERSLVALFITGLMLFNNLGLAKASPATVVYVDPPAKDLMLQATFTISVRVANVANLYGLDLQFTWDPTIIKYVSHTKKIPVESSTGGGGVLHSPTIGIKNNVDETAKMSGSDPGTRYWLAEASMLPAAPFDGDGVVFEMTFKAMGFGNSPLHIVACTLADRPGYPIPLTLQDGFVSVRQGQQTQPPHASFTYTPQEPFVVEEIAFDASASYDPEGEQLGYAWDYGDGCEEWTDSPVTYHGYLALGTYYVRLTVTDPGGGSDDASMTVTVAQVREPSGPTSIRIEPSLNEFGNSAGDPILIPGTQFTVNVNVYSVKNLYGIEIQLGWDRNYIRYVGHARVMRLKPPTILVKDEVDENAGMPGSASGTMYWLCEASMLPAEPIMRAFGTLFKMTFEVIKQPFANEMGNPAAIEPIDSLIRLTDSTLADYDGQSIAHTVTPATVRIWEKTTQVGTDWTFAIITDLHIGRGYDYNGEIGRDFPEYDKKEDYYLTQRLQQVVDWIKTAESIRFVVVLGDITEHGRTCEMEKAKGFLDTLGAIPYFPVMGNHDIKAEGDSVFDNVFDDNFFMTQCGKLGVEWINGRIHVPVDLDPYVPGAELEWRFQNYAFVYNNKRFVFLDYVDRGVGIGTPNLNVPTEDFLQTQLQHGNPTILFSHHPMIEAWSTGCFLGEDIQAIGDVITGTTANVLGNFAGHLHGYFDPAKRFDPYDHLPPPPANPHYMFSNVEYAGEYNTPAGISVIGTEALMVASNELCDWPSMSKGIIRIVRLAGDTFSTSEEGEFSSPSMNPYFAKVDREDPPWGKVTYEFTVYAFNKWFTAENPGTYILDYGDGTQPASLTSTRWDDEPKVFKHDYEGGRSYDVVLRVTGSTAEGQQGDESIKIKIEVPRPWNAFRVKCPVDMIITDPDGHRISKLINEIPGATYTEADLDEDGEIDKLVLIPTLIDGDYTVTLNGTDTGVYHMIAEFVTAGGIVNFTATEIPVSLGATHNFTISWAALFRGEEGVTVQVDSDGDVTFEYAFASDSTLTPGEFLAHTLPDMNGDGIVSILDLVFVSRIYGSIIGDPTWNPKADLAPTYGKIDICDLVTVAFHYGEEIP